MKTRVTAVLGFFAILFILDAQAETPKPNVLFIAIDDMNDWIEPLGGHPQAITPNLNRLAKMGMTFRNAHTASPACHSSRVAVMTGVRPSTSGITANVFKGTGPNWRKNPKLTNVVTLSQHFRNHGYSSMGGGKIYHSLQWWNGSENDPDTWDSYFPEPHKPIPFQVRPPTKDVQAHEASCFGRRPLGNHLFGWLPVAEDDPGMSDYKVVEWALSEMKKKRDKPFFIAAGIFRPHIPWEVPAKYFDMYPLDKVQLPSHQEDDLADTWDHGRRSWHQWVAQNDQWKQAVRGYLASITFADAMVGRLLDGLQQSGRAKDTIIVLWSDHGMHIGEKENWEKFTCWEESTRIPMFVVAPGITKAGSICDRPVSTLDIYPTLAALANTELPEQLEGESLVALLKDPKAGKRVQPAISSYRRIHGVRTDHWRYVFDPGSKIEELYDHRKDQGEHDNLAYMPEHQAILELHRSLLRKYTPVKTPEGKATPPKSFERLPNNRIRRTNYFPMAKAVAEAKAANKRGEPAPILGRKTAPTASKKPGVKKLAVIDPAREGKVRSGGNVLEVHLTFRNQSKAKALIYWINTSGDRVQYNEIKPGAEVRQRTYSGHYWLVTDHDKKGLGIYKAENQDGLVHIR
jgi:arylsulfatase A-like enzyme